MKKITFLLSGCLLLTACIGHETNLEDAQAQRDATLYQKRAQEGCTFLRDQDAYRECLLNTYYSSHPQTYQTAELINGQPLAIVNSTKTYQSGSIPQVAPLPSAEPEVVSFTTSETTRIEADYPPMPTYQPAPVANTIVAEEVVAQNMPVPAAPVVQPQVAPAPVVVPPPAPIAPVQQPAPATWWDVHQEQGVAQVIKPTCPCPDPNDPCPQCYEK